MDTTVRLQTGLQTPTQWEGGAGKGRHWGPYQPKWDLNRETTQAMHTSLEPHGCQGTHRDGQPAIGHVHGSGVDASCDIHPNLQLPAPAAPRRRGGANGGREHGSCGPIRGVRG